MGRNTDTFTALPSLAATLRRLRNRASENDPVFRGEAATTAGRLLASLARAADSPAALPFLTIGLEALAEDVRCVQAVRDAATVTVRPLYAALERQHSDSAVARRVAALRMVADLAGLAEPARVATRRFLADGLARPTGPGMVPGLVQTWGEALEGLGVQDLVDLLKKPTCVGPARQMVLHRLEGRLGRRFSGLWELVTWLEANQPGIDLLTPPRLPDLASGDVHGHLGGGRRAL